MNKLRRTKEPNIFTRENGDGSLTYWLVYNVGGKRRRETFETFQAAKIRKGQVTKDRSEGRPPIPRRVMLRDYAPKCLSGYYGGRKSYPWAKLVIETHLVPFFGDKSLAAIQPSTVRQYQQERLQKVSGATVNREVSVLSKIMTLAVKDGLLQENRVRLVDKKPEPEGRTFYLTAEQAGKLLDACPDELPHLRRLVTVLLETGARLGEALALRWENIDFDTRRIRFDSRTTKASRERFVPMTEEAEAALRDAHRERLKSSAAREWVFTYGGRHLKSCRRAFYSAMETAGIERPKGTGFHLTRHSAATWYMASEGQRDKLQKILGHASAKMTERYVHAGAEYLDTARQHMGRSAIIRQTANERGHMGGHTGTGSGS